MRDDVVRFGVYCAGGFAAAEERTAAEAAEIAEEPELVVDMELEGLRTGQVRPGVRKAARIHQPGVGMDYMRPEEVEEEVEQQEEGVGTAEAVSVAAAAMKDSVARRIRNLHIKPIALGEALVEAEEAEPQTIVGYKQQHPVAEPAVLQQQPPNTQNNRVVWVAVVVDPVVKEAAVGCMPKRQRKDFCSLDMRWSIRNDLEHKNEDLS